ncbi:MAG: hypothetical protein ACREJM_15820 [Candidatus Saccharimonadales bacterium]
MTEALQQTFLHLESERKFRTLEDAARMLGAFPLDHAVRKAAEGCPTLLRHMSGIMPLASEDDAMKLVIPKVLAGGDLGDVADRIRSAVRPAKPDLAAERGARMATRRVAGARRAARQRPPGCY